MILAIDTSCYTTSLAIMDNHSRLIADSRRLLPVKENCRGLRQSEALYAHHQQLPQMIDELLRQNPAKQLTAVAAAARPRPLDGSYMPVFSAGKGIAQILSAALGLPIYSYSHQEGHLAAALWSCELDWQEPFIALHLSGGTGEILLVQPHIRAGSSPAISYHLEIIGQTDLPPGQFVDRIGFALGYPFPAGAALDRLALGADKPDLRLKTAVKGADISFSGPESAAQRAIAQGTDKEQIAWAVFENIAKSLLKAINYAKKQTNIDKVLLMGGVAASQNIRQYLADSEVVFANPKYCADNAVGIAFLALKESDLLRIANV